MFYNSALRIQMICGKSRGVRGGGLERLVAESMAHVPSKGNSCYSDPGNSYPIGKQVPY